MPGTHSPTMCHLILVWNWFNFDAYLSDGWLMQPSSSGGFKGAQEGEPLRWPGIPMPSPIASPRTEAPETTTLTVGAGGDFVGGCGLVARLVQLVMVLTNNLRLMNILQNLQWPPQVVHDFDPQTVSRGMMNSVLGWAIVRMLFLFYAFYIHSHSILHNEM